MGILPYRLDLEFARPPYLTTLVVVICLVVHAFQDANRSELNQNIDAFCNAPRPIMFRMALGRITGETDAEACVSLLVDMHLAADPDAHLRERLQDVRPLAGLSHEDSRAILAEAVATQFRQYVAQAPPYLTAELWYRPASWHPWRMLTASFAHADWGHVIGNVIFFFAFAASVELIVGPVAFVGLIIGVSLFTGAVDSLIALSLGEDIPTLGLSGVVMAMIALLAFFLPAARMRCLLWWLPFACRWAIPVWLVASWYIGWNVWDLFTSEDTGGVNVLAHVSGAAFGYLAGVICLQRRREDIGFV